MPSQFKSKKMASEYRNIGFDSGTPDSNSFGSLISRREWDPCGIKYEIVRQDNFESMGKVLAQKVAASKEEFDLIVSARRGGIFPAQILSAELGEKDLLTYWLSHYQGIEASGEAAARQIKINEDFSDGDKEKIKGKKVLFVDDVNDTSDTLMFSINYLKELGATNVKTAVLHEKPRHRKIEADFKVSDTDAWIIYPWEFMGSQYHPKWEFFAEKLPEWMIMEKDKLGTYEHSLRLSRLIGFRSMELPDISDDYFRNNLILELKKRYKIIYPDQSLPDNIIQSILPNISGLPLVA